MISVGDGRMVIAAAKLGVKPSAEIDPGLVWRARMRARGVEHWGISPAGFSPQT
jgi:hypothetical protein